MSETFISKQSDTKICNYKIIKIRNNLFLQKKLSKKYIKYLNFKFINKTTTNKKLNWKYLINPEFANLMG